MPGGRRSRSQEQLHKHVAHELAFANRERRSLEVPSLVFDFAVCVASAVVRIIVDPNSVVRKHRSFLKYVGYDRPYNPINGRLLSTLDVNVPTLSLKDSRVTNRN